MSAPMTASNASHFSIAVAMRFLRSEVYSHRLFTFALTTGQTTQTFRFTLLPTLSFNDAVM
jgi:hypothetical protein